eukprot:CAMPEP_0115027704 /NCGR_PEP_ID=MMETSP0216-20121206/35734_1 /TAXON_ID=223996 /ORGANISM="Protocruzia adherens, Strain Boccale" /LENGTH=73 /DNA_ID=CAMNT_0002403489 /DNA_START=30 /DNA_END=248 /DNA_ORIENTATION=+
MIDRKTYAMKVINTSGLNRADKEQLLEEVQIHKVVSHPFIILCKEAFMDKKCLCIVMDYADGGNMYTKIAQQK